MNPDCRLKVIGAGELEQELRALAEELNLSHAVEFRGFIVDGRAAMEQFDIFVHPSRWEGFGLVFLEAMAASLPVIATNVSSIPEIVVDGETGLLVDVDDVGELADAIIRLIENPQLAEKMGRMGRKRVQEKFGINEMVEQTCAIYEQVLGERRFVAATDNKSSSRSSQLALN